MNEHDAGDARANGELDEIVDRASFVVQYNATFDFDAGLADVYRRARRAGQVWPRCETWGDPPGSSPDRRRPQRRSAPCCPDPAARRWW
jgi:hypothetical protein